MARFTFLIITLCCCFFRLTAQLLPPNQPEQDACHALQLCGNSFFTPFSYQGNGQVADLPNTPCGTNAAPCGEDNAMWIKLVINTPGSIVFTITPVNPQDDYDFAIVDGTNIDCSNIGINDVIRCNFNNNIMVVNNGIIGLDAISTLTSVIGGQTGDPFLQQITAAAGDIYYIMINNFGTGGGPSSGFTIDFTGSTASFFDNTTPHLNNITSDDACSFSKEVVVHLNIPVACNSITATGSDFQLTPNGSIASAEGINCNGANGYTDKIKITFTNPLDEGVYTIHAQVGTDNNTLLNLCNTPLPIPDFLNFSVDPLFTGNLTPDSVDVCLGDAIKLSASMGVTYNWYIDPNLQTAPDPSIMSCNNCAQPVVKPATVGQSDYYVLIKDSKGCGDTLKSTIWVHDNPVIESFPTDTIIKYGQSVMLHAIGGNDYVWYPSENVSDRLSLDPMVTPQHSTVYVVTGIDKFGCMSTDSSIVRINFRDNTFIPNAFSPNGDGLNDIFKVRNLNFRKLLLFQVFDRWGNKVYDDLDTDTDSGWNGTFKDMPVDGGVYYYIIKLGYADNLVETFKGDITLIR